MIVLQGKSPVLISSFLSYNRTEHKAGCPCMGQPAAFFKKLCRAHKKAGCPLGRPACFSVLLRLTNRGSCRYDSINPL